MEKILLILSVVNRELSVFDGSNYCGGVVVNNRWGDCEYQTQLSIWFLEGVNEQSKNYFYYNYLLS